MVTTLQAEARTICIIVELDQLGAPPQEHRDARREHRPHRRKKCAARAAIVLRREFGVQFNTRLEGGLMRFIPTRIHAVLDWILAPLLIALPWLGGFANGGAQQWIPVALGIVGLIVTFFTDHELGVVRRIPMIGHLWVDGLGGLLLAASPWLFGFSEIVCWPHLVLGLSEFAASLTTKTTPADASRIPS